jgi:SAM-dependent methyltransferase
MPEAKPVPFSERYYSTFGLEEDRIALWFYARILRRLRPRGGRLLDFGCGTGYLLRRLTSSFETYGYDASPHARARCRLNAPDAVVLEEWESLAPESLDIVVALHTLEHLPRPLPTMHGLATRLTEGGLFLFVVPNPGGLGRRLKQRQWFAYRDPTHCSVLSRGEWVTLARRAGFRVDWVRGDGMWDPPYVRGLPVQWQRALFGAPAALQLASPLRRPFLPSFFGECLIIAAIKQPPPTPVQVKKSAVGNARSAVKK